MGSVTPNETANGPRYRVRYRKPDHSQTDKRGFRTKRDAELYLASVTIAKATGDYIDPALSRTTVGHLAPLWIASKRPPVLKPSSYLPIVTSWKTHVEPKWGHRDLASIHPSEVQAWVSELATQRSTSIVLRALGVLAGILDVAVDDRRLSRNPARGLRNLPPRSALFGDGETHMKRENDSENWFAVAVRRAQKIDPSIPRITPHDLRHTAASLAISAGANVKAVQKMLGHASAAMTLDTYADLFDDDLDAVADRMQQAAQIASAGRPWAALLER